MPAPVTRDDLLALLRRSGLIEEADLDLYLLDHRDTLPAGAAEAATVLVRDGLLTPFQAGQLLKGKSRGFVLGGKYRLLDHIGSGGMANVFLCEHTSMRRRVAIKVLPAAQADDPSALERFYREARAVAALDHPHIVRAHDIDRDGRTHFLVMEFVDGVSLQDIVRRKGYLSVLRAAHYVRQAALGLHHAHEAGLVHRDIKPSNLILDRQGTIKILDMGLARFFTDEADDTTRRYDENAVLGTADYLAPEQAINSHAADIRADIYSLGATFYYLLAGQTPFGPGTTAQKIIWHQMKEPTPLRELRPEVPEGLAKVILKMMAKNPDERYQTPAEVYDALAPWTAEPIDPPSDAEIPRASRGSGKPSSSNSTVRPPATSPTPRTIAAGRPAPSGTATKIIPRVPETRPLPRRLLLIGGGGAAALVLLAVVAFLFWPKTPPAATGPVAAGPPPRDTAPAAVQPAMPEGVVLTPVGKGYHVRTPRYQAQIDEDGSLASLKAGGTELLKAGVPFGPDRESRGLYLYSDQGGGLVRANTIEQSGNGLIVRGDKADLRYTFDADGMTWAVTNRGDDPMLHLYGVLDRSVTAVTNGAGEWLESPPRGPSPPPRDYVVAREWTTTHWIAGPVRLTITGGTRLWGPWPQPTDGYHVWDLVVPPSETREARAVIGEASAEERKEAARLAAPATAPGAVTPAAVERTVLVTADGPRRRVRTPVYEATVEEGCLTSLRVQGTELLCSGGAIARGAYFYHNVPPKSPPRPGAPPPGTLRLGAPGAPEPHVVTAKNAHASVRYEFASDTITCHVSNTTTVELAYFVVLNRPFTAARGPDGKQVPLPVTATWPTGTWLAGKTSLTARGLTRQWGPWSGHPDTAQVLQVALMPGKSAKLDLKVTTAPDSSQAAPRLDRLVLDTPQEWQVFQRSSRRQGTIRLQGTLPEGDARVEVRLRGPSREGPLPGAWQPVRLTRDGGRFSGTLEAPAGGWYALEVRAHRGQEPIGEAQVAHVGIGEVFVGAGQSNSTNCGEERQRPATGRVASFDGQRWQPADDPQPGAHDQSTGGSFWPAFGDAIVEKYDVPVGVAVTGHGGTSVARWEPAGELFAWLARRMTALGPRGFRAVLWHQGEADADTSPTDYERRLTEIIRASRQVAGWDVPWFVAQVSYRSPSAPSSPGLRAAQKRLWETGIALEGPDTDRLTGDLRDQNGQGVHFSSRGLRAHGRLWAEKVGTHLDRILDN